MCSKLLIFTILWSFYLIHNVESILLNKNERRDIIRTHNRLRANVNPPSNAMMKLVWHSPGAKKANYLAGKCGYDHDKTADRSTKKYPDGGGQNIYETTAVYPVNWTSIVEDWHSEKINFSYGKDRGNFNDVGHYTQVVWGTTKEIGCARANCKGRQIYVCNYYPPGNSPPYYIPYRKSKTQSCSGCLSNGVCVNKGPFGGKLLKSCSAFCENKYSNCHELAKNYCNQFRNDCALSCRSECKS